jgi:hypothetical protein
VSGDYKRRRDIRNCNWSVFLPAYCIVANIQKICMMSAAVPIQLDRLRRLQPDPTESRISKVRSAGTINDYRETCSEDSRKLRSASSQSISGDPYGQPRSCQRP